MATTTVFPNADGTITGWVNESGGTSNLYQSIDEGTTSPSDSDYVQRTATSVQTTRYWQLGDMPGDFSAATAVTIKIRLARQGSKGDYLGFVSCRLYESDETTVITADSSINDSTTITTYTYNPSITGGTSKSVWDGARIGVTTNSAASNTVRVYAIQVEITYTGGGAIGLAEGDSTASGVSAAIKNSVGSAAGDSTAAAVGQSLNATVGSASGDSTAAGVGRSLNAAVGSAAGDSTAAAVGQSSNGTVGSASGDSTAAAVGQSLNAAVGSAAGDSTASGTSAATKNSVGSASGDSTASAVGQSLNAAVGSAAGDSTASGVGLEYSLLINLIGYWKLDETSGNAIDSHGTNDLTETSGTIDPGQGKINTGRDFEASDTEYFSHADNSDLSTGDISFHLSCWVKPESLSSNPVIAHKGWVVTADADSEWLLYYDTTANRYRFVISSGISTAFVDADNFGAASNGVWHKIDAWHDSTNNLVGIAINNGTANTTSTSIGVNDGNRALELGGSSVLATYWDGLIDEFAFWKRTLSSTERTNLYNDGEGLAYPFINLAPSDAAAAGDSTASGLSQLSNHGSASGDSTAAAVGQSLNATVGSSSGDSTAAATSAATKNSVGSASGDSTASASAASTGSSTGSASGDSTAAGVGRSNAAATGSASGDSTAAAVGRSLNATVGSGSGDSTAAGVGCSNAAATGSASGDSTANASASVPGQGGAMGEGDSSADADGVYATSEEYTASGGFIFSGQALTNLSIPNHDYVATGGLVISGTFSITSANYRLSAIGGLVLLGSSGQIVENLVFPRVAATATNQPRLEMTIVNQFFDGHYAFWGYSKEAIVPAITKKAIGVITD